MVDLAKGHFAALKWAEANTGTEVFNLGTGRGYSVLEIVETFQRTNEIKVPFVYAERRAGDLPLYYGDPEKSRKILGWKTERTLEDMCRDTWNWQKNNPNGYEK